LDAFGLPKFTPVCAAFESAHDTNSLEMGYSSSIPVVSQNIVRPAPERRKRSSQANPRAGSPTGFDSKFTAKEKFI
jgi:hypothetical protein